MGDSGGSGMLEGRSGDALGTLRNAPGTLQGAPKTLLGRSWDVPRWLGDTPGPSRNAPKTLLGRFGARIVRDTRFLTICVQFFDDNLIGLVDGLAGAWHSFVGCSVVQTDM